MSAAPRGQCVGPAAAGFSPPRRTLSNWFIGGIVLAGICGIVRLGSHLPQPCLGPSDLAYYNLDGGDNISRLTTVDGYVASFPILIEGRQWLDIEVESVEVDGSREKVSGRLQLQTRAEYGYRFGESVRVRVQLTEPPILEDFDYRAYLARMRIHGLMLRPHIEPQPGMLRGGLFFSSSMDYAIVDRGC